MEKREKVIKGLESRLECGCATGWDCCNMECPYLDDSRACIGLDEDALALLKAQEPRLLTAKDFHDNPNSDADGDFPAWWESMDGLSSDGWALVNGPLTLEIADGRWWTSRPTDVQRESIPWPET